MEIVISIFEVNIRYLANADNHMPCIAYTCFMLKEHGISRIRWKIKEIS